MATRIQPNGVKLDRLIQDISAGDIKIPAFQRGFVWTQEQVIDLLDSIYNDYPIGSILLWSSKERLKSVRNVAGLLIPERDPDYPVHYVLDGQQRLSAIYGVFAPNKISDPHTDTNIDPGLFSIYFDLRTKTFVTAAQVTDAFLDPIKYPLLATQSSFNHYLDLGALFDPIQWTQHLLRFDPKYVNIAAAVQSKFQNYEVPVVTIRDRSKGEVGTIFERINNTGTKLSILDLMVSWTWSEDFDLRNKIEELLEILSQKGFSDIPDKRVLQCLSAIIQMSARTEDILKLTPEIVRESFEILRKSLKRTVDYLNTELHVESSSVLPHSHQIVSLTYFFSRASHPDRQQSNYLKHWFWATSFSKRYAGATDIKVNEDIEFFDRVVRRQYDGIRQYSHTLNVDTLSAQPFSLNSPLTRAFLLLLAQRKPVDLLNGNTIDIGRALASHNQKEYHHVFPKDFLRSHGIKGAANALCNLCFLSAHANKVITNRPPSDYLFGHSVNGQLIAGTSGKVTDRSIREHVLVSNLLPQDESLYIDNLYERFLEERAKLLIQFLEVQMSL